MRKKNRRARGFFLSSPVSNSAKPKNPLQSPFSSRLILLKVPSANLQQKGLLLKKKAVLGRLGPCYGIPSRRTNGLFSG